MEYFAENRFRVTKALFLEGMNSVLRDGNRKIAVRAAVLMGLLWLALLAFTLLSKGDVALTLGYIVILVLVWLWLFVYMPRGNARRAWKAWCMQYGMNMERVTRFYPEHLEITGSGTKKTVSYWEVLKIIQSRHLLILVCQGQVGIMLALDGFTGASVQEVLERIQRKENVQ